MGGSMPNREDIEDAAMKGHLDELKTALDSGYAQSDIDNALGLAIAYARIDIADYLIGIGGDLSHHSYDGVYYAVNNNQLDGLKYAVMKGVDINVRNGMILNMSIQTAINSNNIEMVEWILSNGGDPNLLSHDSRRLVQDFGSSDLKALIERVSSDIR
jgi:ankyrin repeat protein